MFNSHIPFGHGKERKHPGKHRLTQSPVREGELPLLTGASPDSMFYANSWNYFNFTTGGFWFI